jgi:hypothetical protein
VVESVYQNVFVNGVFAGQARLTIPLLGISLKSLDLQLLEGSTAGASSRLRAFKLTQTLRPTEFWTDFRTSYEVP